METTSEKLEGRPERAGDPAHIDIELATTTRSATVADLKQQQELQHIGTLDRKLKSRHVQFLALSGAIGTGLFVGSGQVLSLAGPLSAFICYAVTGFNLYCVINCLGEMAAWLPIPGAVPIFAARFVDPALGFTLGWNYW
ncbi:amino acid permease [Colletotrichum scovillei]|nr:amino acid permease [Colletotrichum scovillei]KAF4778167.1 amino acid permease [Colletotrichum scovillei]